jgi:hypothetical protein
VQSDDRVTYVAPKQETSGSSRTIEATMRSNEHRWVKRHSSSHYASGGSEVLRNDAAEGGPMARSAEQLRTDAEPT